MELLEPPQSFDLKRTVENITVAENGKYDLSCQDEGQRKCYRQGSTHRVNKILNRRTYIPRQNTSCGGKNLTLCRKVERELFRVEKSPPEAPDSPESQI